jgi:hypothetical protein
MTMMPRAMKEVSVKGFIIEYCSVVRGVTWRGVCQNVT